MVAKLRTGPSDKTVQLTEKKRRFHGWYIVAVAFLTHLASSASMSSTLGVFFKPMSDEFGWPRAYLSGVRSFESLFGGVAASLIGPLLDKHGTRTVMVAGSIIAGTGFIALSQVNDGLQFFLVRGIVICVGVAGFSHMVSSVAISNWFVKKRGRCLGISGSGLATGKVFLAPLITLLMGVWSWREAWVVLGVMVLVLVPIPAALLVRRRPEDTGLQPDGMTESDSPAASSFEGQNQSSAPLAGEVIWTRGQAMRTAAFWLIVLTFGIANVGSQGLALHTIPYLTDAGFEPAMAAGALSILAVFQLTGTIGWGFIVERFPIRYCAMVMFLSEAAAVALMLWVSSPVVMIVGLVAYGFSLSGNSVLQDIIWANYFGRLSLGTIRSIGMPLLVLFSAGGPLYFGYLYDITGGYLIAFLGFMTFLTIAAGLVLVCRPPNRQIRVLKREQ